MHIINTISYSHSEKRLTTKNLPSYPTCIIPKTTTIQCMICRTKKIDCFIQKQSLKQIIISTFKYIKYPTPNNIKLRKTIIIFCFLVVEHRKYDNRTNATKAISDVENVKNNDKIFIININNHVFLENRFFA